jgi:hypothetical protein
MVDSTDCVESAKPVRPDPIDNTSIVVTMFEIYEKTRVNLSISWEHPNATYGDVSAYEVVVTKEPLNAQDSIDTAISVIFRNLETLNDMQNVSLSDVYMQFNIDLHHINNVF